eukprot:854182-Pelagomonas_calceolata.AAC.2
MFLCLGSGKKESIARWYVFQGDVCLERKGKDHIGVIVWQRQEIDAANTWACPACAGLDNAQRIDREI